MRTIIAGTRVPKGLRYTDKFYEELVAKLSDFYRETPIPTEVISGGATGADKAGEMFADKVHRDKVVFHANWNKRGKSAGGDRNYKMADHASRRMESPSSAHLVVLWDMKSSGTKNMMEQAEDFGIKTDIIDCSEIFKKYGEV